MYNKTLSFGVYSIILLILFTIVTMTGSALLDNEDSGQFNSDSIAIYMLDAGHYHLGDGVKSELMPARGRYGLHDNVCSGRD